MASAVTTPRQLAPTVGPAIAVIYFAEHPIIVISTSGIGDILTKLNTTGRVAKWLIELGPRDIRYDYPKDIKAQVLPEFHAEWIEA